MRTLTLVAGQGGLGKSTLLIRFAAELSRGRLLEEGEKGSTVIVTLEDTAEEILRPRAIAAGADLDLLHVVQVEIEEGGALVLPGDLAKLEALVQQVSARLLIIDPIVGTIDGSLDAHKDQDIRRVLAGLARLAEAQDLAVAMVGHLNKGGSRDAYFRVAGSIGFYNAARSVLLVTTDPEHPDLMAAPTSSGVFRIVSQHKANYARLTAPRRYEIRAVVLESEHDDRGRPIETSAIHFVEEAAEIALDDLLAERGSLNRPPQPKRTSAESMLLDELVDGQWHASSDLKARAQELGLSESTLKRAGTDLGVEVVQAGFPRKTFWRLRQSGQGLPLPIELTVDEAATPHHGADHENTTAESGQ